MKLWCCLAVCCAVLLPGCASTAITSEDAVAEPWPRISVEMRFMMVEEVFLEEFGFEFEAMTRGTGQSPEGAFVVPIDNLNTNLLVTASLAQQNSLVLDMPRQTLRPGERIRAWAGQTITFISDLEPDDGLPDGGGIGFEITADIAAAAGEDASASGVRLVLLGRALPEGVYRDDDLRWVSPGDATTAPGHVHLYPGPTFRVQAECADQMNLLVALPELAPAALDDRRALLLLRPVILHSPEMERTLFPGLHDLPSPLGAP